MKAMYTLIRGIMYIMDFMEAALASACWGWALMVILLRMKLGQAGQNGDQDHADHCPCERKVLDELPGRGRQVKAKEVVVHVEPAVRRGKTHLLHGLHQIDLAVGGQLGEAVLADGGSAGP